MTAYESSIAEYGRVAMNKIFTLGSGITQYVSTKTHSGSIRLQISGLPKSWISWQKCRIIWTNYFYYFSFNVRWHWQDEDSNTTLRKLTWLKRLACPQCRIDQHSVTKSSRTKLPVLPPKFFIRKRGKNCHSNLTLKKWDFTPWGTISFLLLKVRHYTLYYMPKTNQ